MSGKPQKRMKLSTQKQPPAIDSSNAASEVTRNGNAEPSADLAQAGASVAPQVSTNLPSPTGNQRQSPPLPTPHDGTDKPAMALSALAAMASAAHAPCMSSSSSKRSSTPTMSSCDKSNGNNGYTTNGNGNSNGNSNSNSNNLGSVGGSSSSYEPTKLTQRSPPALPSSAVAMLAAAAAMADLSPPVRDASASGTANQSKRYNDPGSALDWVREASQDPTARFMDEVHHARGPRQSVPFASSLGAGAAAGTDKYAATANEHRTGLRDFHESKSSGAPKDFSGQLDDGAWAMNELTAIQATWAAAALRQQEAEGSSGVPPLKPPYKVRRSSENVFSQRIFVFGFLYLGTRDLLVINITLY